MTRSDRPSHALGRQIEKRIALRMATQPPPPARQVTTAAEKSMRAWFIKEIYRKLQLFKDKVDLEPGTTALYLSNHTGEVVIYHGPNRGTAVDDEFIAYLTRIPNVEVHHCDMCTRSLPVIMEYSRDASGLYKLAWKTFCGGKDGCLHIFETTRIPQTSDKPLI